MRATRRHFNLWSLLLVVAMAHLFASSPLEAKMIGHISGSYRVEKVTTAGRDAQVTLRIHLVNGSSRDLSNARVNLSGLLWRAGAQSLVSPLVLRPHSSAAFSCQITMPLPSYQRWKRGALSLLSLEIPSASGRPATVVVRLTRSRARGGE